MHLLSIRYYFLKYIVTHLRQKVQSTATKILTKYSIAFCCILPNVTRLQPFGRDFFFLRLIRGATPCCTYNNVVFMFYFTQITIIIAQQNKHVEKANNILSNLLSSLYLSVFLQKEKNKILFTIANANRVIEIVRLVAGIKKMVITILSSSILYYQHNQIHNKNCERKFCYKYSLERVHINRNAQIAKQIFCRARQFFAGVLYVRQEKSAAPCFFESSARCSRLSKDLSCPAL